MKLQEISKTELVGVYTSDMICSQEATLKALAKSLGYRVVKKKG